MNNCSTKSSFFFIGRHTSPWSCIPRYPLYLVLLRHCILTRTSLRKHVPTYTVHHDDLLAHERGRQSKKNGAKETASTEAYGKVKATTKIIAYFLLSLQLTGRLQQDSLLKHSDHLYSRHRLSNHTASPPSETRSPLFPLTRLHKSCNTWSLPVTAWATTLSRQFVAARWKTTFIRSWCTMTITCKL